MTWREMSVEELIALKKVALIDVRSPCEYSVENIPGAVNVPLFTDHEREMIGTIYATEGELVARRRALRILGPKISDLVEEIVQHRQSGAPLVIHCWRGGLRSESVASCLSIIGVDSWRLTGGYKAWRRHVVADFEAEVFQFEALVLDGLTGSGKTELLQALEDAGEPVLDLKLWPAIGGLFLVPLVWERSPLRRISKRSSGTNCVVLRASISSLRRSPEKLATYGCLTSYTSAFRRASEFWWKAR